MTEEQNEFLREQLKIIFERAEKKIKATLKEDYPQRRTSFEGISDFDGDSFSYRYTILCSCCSPDFNYGYISLDELLKDEENAS